MSSKPSAAIRNTLLALAAVGAAGCPSSERPSREAVEEPSVLLRYRFAKGAARRYESTTVERGAFDVTIRMRSLWVVEEVRPDGGADLAVTIERYRHSVFPPRDLSADVRALNADLAGARFRLRVSDDGSDVRHLGVEGVPDVSESTVEALRATLGSHLLKLPEKRVRAGQRWSIEREPAEDAGPGALTTRSRWRVLAIGGAHGSEGSHRPVELVCLSTMEARPVKIQGGVVVSRTEFHYAYLFDAGAGALERLTSTGETTILDQDAGDADAGPRVQRTTFEGRLKLLVTR